MRHWNHGVGRSNPAHTGCATPPDTGDECIPTEGQNADCTDRTPTCVPKAGQDEACTPPGKSDAGVVTEDNPCVKGVEDEKQPPVDTPVTEGFVPTEIAGVETERAPQVNRTGATVLPQTGAVDSLGLLTTGGLGWSWPAR